ncbi:hypothetical protein VXM60_09305 [Shewanella khirikhana]|uniref:hypothetical protein n=1 Tax=Shewanella khirikhana TaxID=1965282 RepID=UPI0030CE1FBA
MDTVLVNLVFLFLAVSLIFSEVLPERYKDRKFEGRAHPLSSNDEILAFSSVFVGAFAFNEQSKWRLLDITAFHAIPIQF